VGPTHSTAPGPHWNARRRKGREGCPLPNQLRVWGAPQRGPENGFWAPTENGFGEILAQKITTLTIRKFLFFLEDRYSQNHLSNCQSSTDRPPYDFSAQGAIACVQKKTPTHIFFHISTSDGWI